MNKITLSAAAWDTPSHAHEALRAALSFPEYYGHNLDALHDCLTSLADTEIILTDCAVPAEKMPEKWPAFLRVFADAAKETPSLSIHLLEGKAEEKRPCPLGKGLLRAYTAVKKLFSRHDR